MFVSVDNIEYHVTLKEATSHSHTLVMLHGFSGTGEVFGDISDELLNSGISTVLIDLPGHGRTKVNPDPKSFDIRSQTYHLLELLEILNLKAPWLYGYSMGGRIALRLAIETGIRLNGLILESAQLGIDNDSERLNRASADRVLAEKLRTNPTHFFETWNRLPLFNSGKLKKSKSILHFESLQQNQNPDLLALTLEFMSPGLVPSVRPDQLEQLPYPVFVLTGELDKKYNSTWVDIVSRYTKIDHISIPSAGHRIHLDQPKLLSKELIHYIKSKH